MKFNVNQQDLQQALNYCQGVIEKRSTLPILSNILLEVKNSKLVITATEDTEVLPLLNWRISLKTLNKHTMFFLPALALVE